MSGRERTAFWIATLVTAATRIWGIARSPWDWDEMLFSLAMRHYDVAMHHPHPPGFPLFIAAAKVFRATGLSDFRSLQAVNIVAGVLLVPAMVFFCRELGLRFSTSLIAALFLAFFPNVWFFGETAFSDVPSVVLVVAACALLLRGRRSNAALMGGFAVLAIAGAFRPQNLAIGFAPAVIALWFALRQKRFAAVAGGLLIASAVLAASYGTAIALTGWERYRDALRAHQEYITATDSFRSPTRPPLHHLIDDFFVRPYRAPLINFLVTAFALISVVVSIVRRRLPVLIGIAAFAPFCLAAWLLLDHYSASRFSIGYAPLIALLAADGVTLIAGARAWAEWSVAVAVTAIMFVWTMPAIDLARRSVSPPLQAMQWIAAHADRSAPLYVHESVGPYTEYFLDKYKTEWTLDGPPVGRLDSRPSFYVTEGSSARPRALNFTWPRGRAWDVARRRYFEVAVVPLRDTLQFGDGWYDEEVMPSGAWRWMGGRASVVLPPIDGKARLRVRLFVPLHVMKAPPSITIRMNGTTIETITPREPFTDVLHDFVSGAGRNVLEIETDRTVNPLREHLGGDPRDLGVRADRLEWSAQR